MASLYSVSTLSVDTFDKLVCAAGGPALSKCERSASPLRRCSVDYRPEPTVTYLERSRAACDARRRSSATSSNTAARRASGSTGTGGAWPADKYSGSIVRVRSASSLSPPPSEHGSGGALHSSPSSPCLSLNLTTPPLEHPRPLYSYNQPMVLDAPEEFAGYELQADNPLYLYELDTPNPKAPLSPVFVDHTALERCTGSPAPLSRERTRRESAAAANTVDRMCLGAGVSPGPGTSAAPSTAGDPPATSEKNATTTARTRRAVPLSEWSWSESDESDADDGIIWFGRRTPPSPERVHLFWSSVGTALEEEHAKVDTRRRQSAPAEPSRRTASGSQSQSAAKRLSNNQIVYRLVGAWRHRRRSRA